MQYDAKVPELNMLSTSKDETDEALRDIGVNKWGTAVRGVISLIEVVTIRAVDVASLGDFQDDM
jgi:hypothetical protein